MRRLLAAILAVPFYQSPKSLFPSGEANFTYLDKNKLSVQKQASLLVEKDRRSFWVAASDVVRDSDFNQDTAITITNTQIRESDSWKSSFVATVPSGSKLKVLRLKDTWAEVVFESVGQMRGWVDLNNVILKADFAAFIQLNNDPKWHAVRFREGTVLVTENSYRLEISNVSAMKTRSDLAISIASNEAQKLLLRQHLKVVKADSDIWNLSRLPGHGDVYWKSTSALSPADNNSVVGISTEELLKREIASVSFHPRNPNMGIAAAQGVFITTDGKHWKQLNYFGKKNFPVLIDHVGALYVGGEKSTDQGKTFTSYLRWDQLAHLVESYQGYPNKQMRIKELQSPRPGILELQLETDLGKVKLAGRSDFSTISKWDFN